LASVNPQTNPTNAPGYGGNSRAIDTPDPIRRQGVQQNQILPEGQKIGDRSAEYEGQAAAAGIQADALTTKGYGDLFANIINMGDFLGKAGVSMVKKDIEEKVYDIADKERQAYTAELEKIKAGGTKNILDANASADEPTPDDVNDLPQTLATLKSARDGGKISKIDYQGRLLEHAKSLRAQYPGFKKEIDDEFAKVTGQNPANARINSLITDINRTAAAASSEANKAAAYYKSHQGWPNMQKEYDKFVAGETTANQFYSKFTPYAQAEETMRAQKLLADSEGLTRDETGRRAVQAATTGLGTVVAAHADQLLGDLGLDSPDKVKQFDDLNKNGSISKEYWNDLNKKTANSIVVLQTQMASKMDSTGITAKLKGGVEERNKLIKEAMAPVLAIQDRIINHDTGGLYENAQRTKSILDGGKYDLVKDSKAGPAMVALNNMKELGGEQYLQKFNLELAVGKDGIPNAYKDWYNGYKARFNGNAANPAAAVTYNTMFDEAKTKGINDPAINRGIVKEVDKIGQKDVPDKIKEGIALSAFSPGNRGFLSRINLDTYDERGRYVPGQNAVYQKWTAPEITNEIKRLSKNNPQLWENYESWARDTFKDQIVNTEINDLAKQTRDPNIKISWDTDNKRFDVEKTWTNGFPNQKIGMTASEQALGGGQINIEREKNFENVRRSIYRINSALSNLKNVAQEGVQEKDTDGFLLQSIADAAGPDALKNVKGIPVDMLNKIMLGRAYGGSKR
jgi:hypothetical protein